MPQYPIPPWLHGADTANQYGRGYGLGQQGAELQARAALEQQRMQAEAWRTQQALLREQQRTEIERQLSDQKLAQQRLEFEQYQGQQQQKQDLQKQEFEMYAKQAAVKSAAQLRISSRIAAGEDPDKVYLEEGAQAGTPGPEMVQFAKQAYRKAHPFPDPTERTFGGEQYLVSQTESGPHYQHIPKSREGSLTMEDQGMLKDGRSVIQEFEKKWSDPINSRFRESDPATKKEYEQELESARFAAKQIQGILPGDPIANRILGGENAVRTYDPSTGSWSGGAPSKSTPAAPGASLGGVTGAIPGRVFAGPIIPPPGVDASTQAPQPGESGAPSPQMPMVPGWAPRSIPWLGQPTGGGATIPPSLALERQGNQLTDAYQKSMMGTPQGIAQGILGLQKRALGGGLDLARGLIQAPAAIPRMALEGFQKQFVQPTESLLKNMLMPQPPPAETAPFAPDAPLPDEYTYD